MPLFRLPWLKLASCIGKMIALPYRPADLPPGRQGPGALEASATGRNRGTLRKPRPWSTVGPHSIGAERFPAVSNGSQFAQVPDVILGKQAWGQNPDKTPMAGGRHEG